MTNLIAFENVSIEREGAHVLRNVSFTLAPGERLAIVGANGAGKTTLLRAIVGLQPITSGRIVAFGRERKGEADFHEVRLKAAYMFQDADDQLFCPTVVEDVAFGPLNMGLPDEEAMARARATLTTLGLAHLADRLVRRLSGGEKRMVCLAGVLAMNPDVLLLDEPTNSLDAGHLERLTQALQKIDKAMVIVSHDRPLLDCLATRALAMRDGALAPAVLHRHPHGHEHAHDHGHVHL
ncbi:MAG: ATP-binding cassette domain-containing protein [Beijerinckiaceae bacterium]|nr:ATP-binding cassette domain-containing protein [Beijerinckiaceae bacterium]